jgi:hypothetical protein
VGNSEKKLPRSGFVHLAINTGSSISISSTYIVFLTKLQKRQNLEKGFALLKNDITGFERTVKMLDT